MITFRGVWRAVAVVAAAAITVVILRSLRAPTRRRPLHQDETISGTAPPVQAENEPVSQWPPAPVLGTPSTEDLKRYAVTPSAFRSALEGFFRSPSREPLDEATQRRLTRWGSAGLALLFLVGGTQALEAAVFSKEPAIEAVEEVPSRYPADLYGGVCLENPLHDPGSCFLDELERVPFPSGDGFPQPAQDMPVYEPTLDADCHPTTGTPRVRPLSPKVTRAVNRQWRRIEAWLRTNAPRSYRTLGKPGKAETIAVAEAQMGLRFPDDLRASLLRHDGAVFTEDIWTFGFLGNENLSIPKIRDTWRQLCEIDAVDNGDGAFFDPRTDWWDGRMIPFGADGMGDHLVIDSVKRDIGDTDHEGTMSFTPGEIRLRSYYALLKATADAMENGGSIGYWKPEAVSGELEWKVLLSHPEQPAGSTISLEAPGKYGN